ncbi:unnamed protein product [Hymenolepis diminuta]|uniref:Uncharacterized protein n=1 Tax=Hymenolepis diminuta TaxID=6216 RepID=A0A564Y998_HYMDI|nr:unnamed protein product [Hymenolepis diminuta]
MKNNHARRVHDSNLNTTSDQQSTDMKVNELKDWVKTNSAEIICIPPQTADARLVITTTSSLSDLAASSDQSTHLFKPHARSTPNLKMNSASKETTAPNDGLCVILVTVLCYVFLRCVLAFTLVS